MGSEPEKPETGLATQTPTARWGWMLPELRSEFEIQRWPGPREEKLALQ